MMTRLVSWLFFISLGAVAVLLLLPGFIDWTRHKDLLVSEVSGLLQQEVHIDGDVSLQLFPNPQITLENVTIGPKGDGYLLKLAQLQGRMSLQQLLHGRFEVDHIHLNAPVMNIAAGPQGSNWAQFWRRLHDDARPRGGKLVVLRQVSISRGSLVWQVSEGAAPWELGQINMTLSAASLAGPYTGKGDFLYGDEPATFTLEAGPKTPQGELPFTVAVEPIQNLPVTTLKGALSASGAGFAADVTARDGQLEALLAAFPSLRAALADLPVPAGEGDASFSLNVTGNGVSLKNIKAAADKTRTLAGDISFPAGKAALDADVTLTDPRYWQAFKGSVDLARGTVAGDTTFKIENAGRLLKGMPAVSVEAEGRLRRQGANWSIENLQLSLPEWKAAGFAGMANSNGQGVQIVLENGTVASLQTVGVEAQVSPAGDLSGKITAQMNGKPLAATLSGRAEMPDVAADLAGLPPQDALDLLGARPEIITLEGGASAFKGQLDMAAPSAAAAIKGALSLSPAKIGITGFDPAALQKALLEMQNVPDDLPARLADAVKSGKGVFTAKALSFDLPAAAAWEMREIAYDGGVFDLAVKEGKAHVSVRPAEDGMPAYRGTLPFGEDELQDEGFAAFIVARHPPVPEVDTKDAIGGILDRLDTDAPAVPETADEILPAPPVPEDLSIPLDDAVLKPPADMPPQPLPPLHEVEVPPAPALPESTPLAVDPPPGMEDLPVEDDAGSVVPDEIFPLEETPQ